MAPRTALYLLALGAALALQPARLAGQSSLPATPPSAIFPQPAPLAATSDGAASRRAQKAVVTYEDGLLDVRANNSSLNGILREISRATGMKLTGSVAEQRVFGNYGPAAPATVLATLLDGTGSNMLLRETADASPAELILTPRVGGPSPPSVASSTAEPEDGDGGPGAITPSSALDGQNPAVYGRHGLVGAGLPRPTGALMGGNGFSGPRSLGQPGNNVNGSPDNVSPTAATYPTTNSVPLDAVPTPSTTPAVSGIVDAPNPPPPGTTTSMGSAAISAISDQQAVPGDTSAMPSSSTPAATTGAADAPKTPEQVFQLLQQLRQQSIQQQKQ